MFNALTEKSKKELIESIYQIIETDDKLKTEFKERNKGTCEKLLWSRLLLD